ncbi:MAG TPA: ankyrin repeat domain-containing protein [Verrucomicrobiae bacterium]|nr:ankyrin repeat domain-containing protein [Verrucomicrobiae bacterium]
MIENKAIWKCSGQSLGLIIIMLVILACNSRSDEELRRAAIKGEPERVKEFLMRGANVRYRHGGWTVLMFAAREGHVDIVRLLLDSGADPNATSDNKYDGARPLTIAAEHGNVEVIKLLLSRGADVNGRNAHGDTALMYGAQYNHVDVAKVLLNANADTQLVDHDGDTALMIAQRMNHPQMVILLNLSRQKN